MRTRLLAFLFAFALSVGCPFGLSTDALSGGKAVWIEQLQSRNSVERREARAFVIADRKRTIELLLSVVRKPVAKGEEFYIYRTPRNMAMSLLGKLRAKEAVPDLVSWLEPREGQGDTVVALTALPPAGQALVEIGLPSVPPVLDIIRQKGCSSPDTRKVMIEGTHVRYEPRRLESSSWLGDRCLLIMSRVKGVEETEFTLQKAIEAESDSTVKENLQSALTLLNHPKSRGRFIRK